MSKTFKILLYSSLFAAIFAGLGAFCYKQNDGFFPYQIPSSLPFHKEWEVAANTKEPFSKIFSQPFRYLGKGCQCFVFASEDSKYILKLPYHSHLQPPIWLRPIPLLAELYRVKRMLKGHRTLQRDATSYLLAYDKFQEETGLLYVHLNKTDYLHQKVQVFDKIGVEHILDLDNHEFILQKKAEPFYPKIDQWMSQGKIEQAKIALSELCKLLYKRYEHGIDDRERNFDGNYGFIEDKPIQIDIGRFRAQEASVKPEEEIERLLVPLKAKLKKDYPELHEHLVSLPTH